MKSPVNRLVLLSLLLLSALGIQSQDARYIFNKDKSVVSVEVDINQAKLKAEDEYNKRRGLPLRIAKNYAFNVNNDTIGVWKSVKNGGRSWKFTMDVPGAKGLIVSFSDFYIPQGGRLYVYAKGEQRNENTWTYTHEDNPRGGAYSLEVYSQDNIVFEYLASPASHQAPRFITTDFGYKYSDPSGFNHSQNGCMININCPQGDSWQKQKMGLIRLRVNAGLYSYACTGSLVNNVKQDKAPYVLTAAHCFPSGDANDVVNTEFFFDYEFSGCSNSTTRPQYKYVKGADLLVMNHMADGSDGALIKITQGIPEDWNVYFNGWSLADTDGIINNGSVIHHPQGDVKKITFYENYLTTDRWYDPDDAVYSAPNAHWVTKYTSGSTAGGSSGAPIFDNGGLIVGTLTGGDAGCNGRNINNGTDFYGKMAYHWDKNTDPNKHMRPYLDPDNTGTTTLSGIFNEKDLILSLPDVTMEEYSTVDVTILKGNGGYSLSSADENIASAMLDGNKITIFGNKEGNTVITVTDRLGKTLNLPVIVTELQVQPLKLDEDTAVVFQDKSRIVEIVSGNGGYKIELLNPTVASATIEENLIEIKGLNIGKTELTVQDKLQAETAKLVIEVRRLLEIYPSTKSELYVRINDAEDQIKFVTIADLSGRVLYNKKNVGSNELRVDISAIRGGAYLVMVKTLKRKTETRKIAW